MKIGVLGTGMVGKAIATKLVAVGHEVMMGSRTPDNEKAAEWVISAGERATQGTFADAGAFGEAVFVCTGGMVTLEVLESVGAERLAGKILVDISNPLDFSNGFPPTLSVCNDSSLAEQIQAAYPDARVVKTLNTVNCDLMVDASLVPDTTLFISGNDEAAKSTVRGWLRDWFGWQDILDLGDITTARGTEQLLPIWVRLYAKFGAPSFNFKIVRSDA